MFALFIVWAIQQNYFIAHIFLLLINMFKNGQAKLCQDYPAVIVAHHCKEFNEANQGPFLVQTMGVIKSKPQKKRDHWTQQEQIKYVAFLSSFEKELLWKSRKINWNIYKLMAKFIKSRNPNQCRIHHIHMLKHHQTPKTIINHFGLTIINYKQKVLAEKESLWTMNQHKQLVINLLTNATTDKVQAIQQLKINKVQYTGEDQIKHGGDQDSKKMNEENVRTDETYHDQDNKHPSKRQTIKQLPLFSSPYYQPQLNQPTPYFVNAANSDPYHNPFALSNSNIIPYADKTENDWQQCHQLFLAWSAKLKKLMQSQ